MSMNYIKPPQDVAAPLFCHFPGQRLWQRAFIYLDPAAKSVMVRLQPRYQPW